MFLHIFRLEEIGAAAAKEHSLEKAMEKMKAEWKDLRFDLIPYRDTVSRVTSHSTHVLYFIITEPVLYLYS